MPICYWNLCHCPDATPCVEHNGANCGTFNNRLITDESQVSDAFTDELYHVIQTIDEDIAKIDRARAALEQEKQEIEREQRDLQQQVAQSKGFASGRQVLEKLQQEMDRVTQRRDDLQRRIDDLTTIINRPDSIRSAKARLIIPFFDPSGYCACYQAKKARLAALATQIDDEQAHLDILLNVTWPHAQQIVKLSLIALFVPATVGIFILVKLAVFLLFSGPLAVFDVVLTALAVVAALLVIVGAMIYAYIVAAQISASRKRLIQLILQYYRIQRISTCQKG
jgi:hypothetical protein